MKSLAAYGRRLALSLLVALWSVSLVRVVVVFVDSNARTSAIGFADLYGFLLPRLNSVSIIAIEIALGLATIATAWWEIDSSDASDDIASLIEPSQYQQDAPTA